MITSLVSACSQSEVQAEYKKINEAWNQILISYQERSDLLTYVLDEIIDDPETDNHLVQSAINSNNEFILIQRSPDIQKNTTAMTQFVKYESKASEDLSQILLNLKKNNYHRSEVLIDTSNEIYQIEHEIAKLKLSYISAVQNYNNKIGSFPNNIYKILGVTHEMPYLPLMNEGQTTSMPIKK